MPTLKQWTIGALLGVVSLTAFSAELHLYAGAGLRQPVEAVVRQFEEQTGNRVIIEYGGSGQILTRFNLTKAGDLFLPGSADYVEKLQQEDQVTDSAPLVLHTPVMVVRKAVAGNIKTLEDLANSSLKIGMGDPKAIALGKSGDKLLVASGYEQALKSKVTVQTTTIKQLLIYLLNGDIDAAVIGRSDAVKNQDTLLMLPSPEGTPEEVATIAVLKTSKHPQEAKALMDFFASEQGIKRFTDLGYLPVKAN
ncbi:Putative binding protein HI_1525 precursor [Leminorella richardii]|uniref:Binding protein HI_1525 n=1 Tax=Leminorella richardii TaxID=158841 RepID=A0A2X4UDD4_9GAMM|nr:molybdate ABC transporter substrate-binding protein [Leminorella richardii]SQI36659.1 Putative binding protein HI_1525 precursor [Leminorella richardii]